ncbi:MAG: COX15/CtaA family protein [Cytophagaceae bacterium]
MRKNTKIAAFGKLGLLTIFAVYFLILVGGIVRSTGSGMGCPDWPKCFGKWVPPTNISELPDDYREIYIEKRRMKNIKFAALLESLSFKSLAQEILNDQSVYQGHEFNLKQTWIEYLNRIVGVIIGFLILAVLVKSFSFWNTDKTIFLLSLGSFVLVGFQGWLGSVVVSTNLMPFMITLHMILALVIVAMLIYTVARSQRKLFQFPAVNSKNKLMALLYILIGASFFQIITGTQVREEIDVISTSLGEINRNLWLSETGLVYYIHRSFSIAIVLVHAYFFYLVYSRHRSNTYLYRNTVILLALLLAEIVIALVLAYFGFPAFAQPLHLLFGSLIIGFQFYLIIILLESKGSISQISKTSLVLNDC